MSEQNVNMTAEEALKIAEEQKQQADALAKAANVYLKREALNGYTPGNSQAIRRMPISVPGLSTVNVKELPKDSPYLRRPTQYVHYTGFDTDKTYQAHQWKYKKDENEAGWGPGMDDLARILLDNKSVVKFNRDLCNLENALGWVANKNKTVTNGKYWKAIEADVNEDGYPEVLILDGNGNIRYLDGFHIGKKKIALIKEQMNWIHEKYGTPADVRDGRLKGTIGKGDTSFAKFMSEKTSQDPNNPDGPVIADKALLKAGYKPRPLNPCNIFMKYIVKPQYMVNENKYAPELGDEDKIKLYRKLASIIQVNAKLYTKYVANPAYEYLKGQGYSDRAMKKKGANEALSPFSRVCGAIIEQILNQETEQYIKQHEEIGAVINAFCEQAYKQASGFQFGKRKHHNDKIPNHRGNPKTGFERGAWENSVIYH